MKTFKRFLLNENDTSLSKEEISHLLDEVGITLTEQQIDELSRGTLARYTRKAAANMATAAAGHMSAIHRKMPTSKYLKRYGKRFRGIDTATKKLAKEETDIQELSKDTLRSYAHKAVRHMGRVIEHPRTKEAKDWKKKYPTKLGGPLRTDKEMDALKKRHDKIIMATDKIKNEEHDEPYLRKLKTFKSYVKKARTDIENRKKVDPSDKKIGKREKWIKHVKGWDKNVTEETQLHEVKKLGTYTSSDKNRAAKVYSKNEHGEHVVKHFENGKHQVNADYHTDDVKDAHGTAKKFVGDSHMWEETKIPHPKKIERAHKQSLRHKYTNRLDRLAARRAGTDNGVPPYSSGNGIPMTVAQVDHP